MSSQAYDAGRLRLPATANQGGPSGRSADWFGWAAPLLSGVAIGLSQMDERWAWLAWFSLVPLGLAWTRRSDGSTSPTAALLGGTLAHLMALSWMPACYREAPAWLGPHAPAWLVISLMAGALFAVFCSYGRHLIRTFRLPAAVALPLAWTSYELAKFYIGVMFDQTGFPWAKLGLTQAAWLEFAQIADLGGELLLGFVVALVNGALVDGVIILGRHRVQTRRWAMASMLGGACVLITTIGYGKWRMSQPISEAGPVICLMGELDLPPFVDRNRIVAQTTIQPTLASAGNESPRPKLLLWPELALHHRFVAPYVEGIQPVAELPDDLADLLPGELPAYVRYVRRCLRTTAADLDAVVVIGCERLEPTGKAWRRFNSIACVDPTGESISYYDKKYLVPWSEYLPYAAGSVGTAPTSFCHGDEPGVFRVACGERTYRFRAAICYDLCFSEHFRPTADKDGTTIHANFFVQCGSEGQDQTGTLSNVLFRMAQLRAIESRRAIVRNINLGYSALIDSHGRPQYVIGRQPITAPVVLPAVPIDRQVSLYATWGDAPLTLICATMGILVVLRYAGQRIGITGERSTCLAREWHPD